MTKSVLHFLGYFQSTVSRISSTHAHAFEIGLIYKLLVIRVRVFVAVLSMPCLSYADMHIAIMLSNLSRTLDIVEIGCVFQTWVIVFTISFLNELGRFSFKAYFRRPILDFYPLVRCFDCRGMIVSEGCLEGWTASRHRMRRCNGLWTDYNRTLSSTLRCIAYSSVSGEDADSVLFVKCPANRGEGIGGGAGCIRTIVATFAYPPRF